MSGPARRPPLLALVGPGMLVAATGVGAGDLYTAGFAGQQLGTAVLWAVAAGALLKLVLNEGLARWQLATGETLLEGASARLGLPFRLAFGIYLVGWSWFVASALVGACGVTLQAIAPLGDPAAGRAAWGIAASAAGVAVALAGGFRLFERVMAACIGVMFATAMATAVLVNPDWGATLAGLVVPRIPRLHEGGVGWTLALMGGVGGTVTVLGYGYWIREAGRTGPDALRDTRIDLASGYAMTAFFGMAMVIIGSGIEASGSGAGFIVGVADRLGERLGSWGRWAFLAGAFGAVFSSLLGVWQSVPYLFADLAGLALGEPVERRRARVATTSWTYRGYLLLLAAAPLVSLRFPFRSVQKAYALVGALFMPFLALLLLYLLGTPRWAGALANRRRTNLLLAVVLLLFLVLGGLEARRALAGAGGGG